MINHKANNLRVKLWRQEKNGKHLIIEGNEIFIYFSHSLNERREEKWPLDFLKRLAPSDQQIS